MNCSLPEPDQYPIGTLRRIDNLSVFLVGAIASDNSGEAVYIQHAILIFDWLRLYRNISLNAMQPLPLTTLSSTLVENRSRGTHGSNILLGQNTTLVSLCGATHNWPSTDPKGRYGFSEKNDQREEQRSLRSDRECLAVALDQALPFERLQNREQSKLLHIER